MRRYVLDDQCRYDSSSYVTYKWDSVTNPLSSTWTISTNPVITFK